MEMIIISWDMVSNGVSYGDCVMQSVVDGWNC